MRKVIAILAAISFVLPSVATAAEIPLAKKLAGRILLQTDARGEAWYVRPKTLTRYYLGDTASCVDVMRSTSLGITNADLKKIPSAAENRGDTKLVRRLSGWILLAVEQQGQAWYVNPLDNRRHYLADGAACMEILRKFGLGITTANLRKIPMNGEQITFDRTYNAVASARIIGNRVEPKLDADHILPIASLTKLMTALVLLDQRLEWNKEITITADDLAYPKQLVDPGDITSEVPLQAGDTIKVLDLWQAMLVASSNQAAWVLAKHSGLTPEAFVAAMNAKAQSLGLQKTMFTEPTGLDPANISTAVEMAHLALAAFKYPEIASTSVLNGITMSARQPDQTIRDIPVVNRNYSLLQFNVDGAKTGFLYEAQRSVAVQKGNITAVVLHARSMKERNQLIEKLLISP